MKQFSPSKCTHYPQCCQGWKQELSFNMNCTCFFPVISGDHLAASSWPGYSSNLSPTEIRESLEMNFGAGLVTAATSSRDDFQTWDRAGLCRAIKGLGVTFAPPVVLPSPTSKSGWSFWWVWILHLLLECLYDPEWNEWSSLDLQAPCRAGHVPSVQCLGHWTAFTPSIHNWHKCAAVGASAKLRITLNMY